MIIAQKRLSQGKRCHSSATELHYKRNFSTSATVHRTLTSVFGCWCWYVWPVNPWNCFLRNGLDGDYRECGVPLHLLISNNPSPAILDLPINIKWALLESLFLACFPMREEKVRCSSVTVHEGTRRTTDFPLLMPNFLRCWFSELKFVPICASFLDVLWIKPNEGSSKAKSLLLFVCVGVWISLLLLDPLSPAQETMRTGV